MPATSSHSRVECSQQPDNSSPNSLYTHACSILSTCFETNTNVFRNPQTHDRTDRSFRHILELPSTSRDPHRPNTRGVPVKYLCSSLVFVFEWFCCARTPLEHNVRIRSGNTESPLNLRACSRATLSVFPFWQELPEISDPIEMWTSSRSTEMDLH